MKKYILPYKNVKHTESKRIKISLGGKTMKISIQKVFETSKSI